MQQAGRQEGACRGGGQAGNATEGHAWWGWGGGGGGGGVGKNDIYKATHTHGNSRSA